MKIFNSMNQKVKEFKPLHENKVHMYVYGPTVYNYPHIGNARPIVVFGTLKRTFQAIRYNVRMMSSYTNVDDKVIRVAKEYGVSEAEITEKFTDACNHDRLSLHAAMPDAAPRATETMDAITAFIKLLVDKGHAYEIEGDVYFGVNSAESYGKLSNQQIEDLLVGARIDENGKKENPLGFTLWKKTEEGIKWDSPWSVGRPGRHTECVVMINQEFDGEHMIDIHGSGVDLKFPHRENEIAQSRAAYDSPIANYWVHDGMVNISGKKMFKNLGNVVWAKDMITKIGGDVLRWVILSAHYRTPLNINEETTRTAKKRLSRMATAMKQAYIKLGLADADMDETCDEEQLTPFLDVMQDDVNTSNAFAAVFETVKALNRALRQRESDLQMVKALVRTLKKVIDVLDIELLRLTMSEESKQLYRQWKATVRERDFETADQYRAKLIEKGIL